MVSMMGGHNTARDSRVVNGAQLRELLLRRRIGKLLAKEFFALLIYILESRDEMRALIRGGPLSEDHVDEFIYASALGAGSVGRRNNLFGHCDNGVVQVRRQRAQSISGRRLRLAKQRE